MESQGSKLIKVIWLLILPLLSFLPTVVCDCRSTNRKEEKRNGARSWLTNN